MSLISSCHALAPQLVCRHAAPLIYLTPSLLLAGVIRMLAARHPLFFIFTLAGTICHELAHFCVGVLVFARPASLTVIPRRKGQGWQLGSVLLTRVRWYNAAPAALAPCLILVLPWLVASWRTHEGLHFLPIDLALAFLLAPQFLAFWPSTDDWRIALRSWPMLLVGAAGFGLFQIVRT